MSAANDTAVLTRLRKICGELPECEETETFGHPTFRVAGKTFCVFDEYKGERAIAVQVGLPVQSVFLQDPRFYKTPYSGRHGWVSLRIGGNLDWHEVAELVTGSYRLLGRRSSAARRSVRRR